MVKEEVLDGVTSDDDDDDKEFTCSLVAAIDGSDRNPCSNSNNWPIKLRFGDMMGRRCLTIVYASTKLRWA